MTILPCLVSLIAITITSAEVMSVETLLTKAKELDDVGGVPEEIEKVALEGLHILDIPESELPDFVFAMVARVCLNLANNCNTGQLMETVANYLVLHTRWDSLPQSVQEDSLVMLAEQLIVMDRMAEAREILGPWSGTRIGIQLQLLKEVVRRIGVQGSYDANPIKQLLVASSEKEKDEARELFGRIEIHFNSQDRELDELLNIGVDICLYNSKQQRPHIFAEGLSYQPVWSLDILGRVGDELAQLQLQWRVLRREALNLVQHYNWTTGVPGWVYSKDDLDQDGRWKQLVFSGSGLKRLPGQLCSVVPTLCGVATKFPGALSSRDGRLKIAVLEGNSRIKPHCGVTNAKLRVNLPLVVPQDAASYIRVGDIREQLEEGKIVVFDDSFEHEAWNSSPTDIRVVLLLDINHPELSVDDAEKYADRLREITHDFEGPNYDDMDHVHRVKNNNAKELLSSAKDEL